MVRTRVGSALAVLVRSQRRESRASRPERLPRVPIRHDSNRAEPRTPALRISFLKESPLFRYGIDQGHTRLVEVKGGLALTCRSTVPENRRRFVAGKSNSSQPMAIRRSGGPAAKSQKPRPAREMRNTGFIRRTRWRFVAEKFFRRKWGVTVRVRQIESVNPAKRTSHRGLRVHRESLSMRDREKTDAPESLHSHPICPQLASLSAGKPQTRTCVHTSLFTLQRQSSLA
jgi:hypothetical protein